MGKVIKVPIKTNNFFNSTMMASFLPVIVSKKNKQTFYYSVSQIHINPEKKHEKTLHNDCLNLPIKYVRGASEQSGVEKRQDDNIYTEVCSIYTLDKASTFQYSTPLFHTLIDG